jgi:hypothetical protein
MFMTGVPHGAGGDVLPFSCHQASLGETSGMGFHREPVTKEARSHSSFQYRHRAQSMRFPRLQPLLLPAMAIRSQVPCFA